jgi:hypothetical protein
VVPVTLQITNQIAPKDSSGTNWTTMDSITQQFFCMGLIWTLLAPFQATRYTNRDTKAKTEIWVGSSSLERKSEGTKIVPVLVCRTLIDETRILDLRCQQCQRGQVIQRLPVKPIFGCSDQAPRNPRGSSEIRKGPTAA